MLFAGQHVADFIFFPHQFPKRLGNTFDIGKRGSNQVVPKSGVTYRVVRKYLATAVRCTAKTGKRFFQIESAVIVGNFFAGLNVAYGDFEIVTGTKADCRAGVIDESTVVPAENAIAAAVQIGVLESLSLHDVGHGMQHLRRNNLIEHITDPGDGALRNQSGGK